MTMSFVSSGAERRRYGAHSKHPGGLVETPYVLARREWDARLGATVIQAKNWRVVATGAMTLLGVALAGILYLATRATVVPHVIEVGALGEASYRGPAGDTPYTPTEAVVRYQLRHFLDLSRTITSDNVLLRRNWFDVYKMLTATGGALMNEWVTPNDPTKRAQTETTAIEVLSAVPLSTESWQMDWRETTWDRSGQPIGKPVLWRALLKVVIQPPTTRQQMIDNPLGIFVDEFHWDRIQQGKP